MWGTSSLFTWDPYFHGEEEALTQQANLQVFFLAGWFSTWFFLFPSLELQGASITSPHMCTEGKVMHTPSFWCLNQALSSHKSH